MCVRGLDAAFDGRVPAAGGLRALINIILALQHKETSADVKAAEMAVQNLVLMKLGLAQCEAERASILSDFPGFLDNLNYYSNEPKHKGGN